MKAFCGALPSLPLDQRGAMALEFGLIFGCISMTVIIGLLDMGTSIHSLLTSINDALVASTSSM